MWRRITAGWVAVAMSFGWASAGWAEVVVGEEIMADGVVALPADTIPPEEMSDSQVEVIFQGNLLGAMDSQGVPSVDIVTYEGTPQSMYQDPETGEIMYGTADIVPEGMGDYSDPPVTEMEDYGYLMDMYLMDMLIGQIDGEISAANWTAYELTMALDFLEQSPDEGGGLETTGSVAGETTAAEGAEEPEEEFFVSAEGESMELEEVQSPPPIVGTATGPTTAAGIQTMLQGRVTTFQGQRDGLLLAQTNLIAIRDRAQRLFNVRAIARVELDHANAMVNWIGRRIARVNALIAIASAPAANVPALVGAFNGQAVTRLAARVAFLEAEETRLVSAINAANGLGAAASAEERNRLQIALGFVRVDLAQARQEKADGQATAAAGGIVLIDWDPAPPFPGR